MPRNSQRTPKRGGNNSSNAIDNDDAVSVASSVGSRSSLRLKRKREEAAASRSSSRFVPPVLPEDGDHEEDDGNEMEQDINHNDNDANDDDGYDELERDRERTKKRPRRGKTPAKKIVLEDEDDDEELDDAEAEENDAEMEENQEDDDEDNEMQDSKLPASIQINNSNTSNGQQHAAVRDMSAGASASAAAVAAPLASTAAAATATPPAPRRSPAAAFRANNGAGGAGTGRWNLTATQQEPTPFKTVRKATPARMSRLADMDDDNARQRPDPLLGGDLAHDGAIAAGNRLDDPNETSANDDAAAVDPTAPSTSATWSQTATAAVAQWLAESKADDVVMRFRMDRTSTWVAFFLILQIVCFPIWLHPILSSTVSFSKICLTLYQGLLTSSGIIGGQQLHETTKHRRDAPESAVETLALDLKIKQALQTVQARQLELDTQEEQLAELSRQYDELVIAASLLPRLPPTTTIRADETTVNQLRAVTSQLELLMSLENEPLMGNPLVTTVTQLLAQQEKGATSTTTTGTSVPHPLLDLSTLQLWPLAENGSAAAKTAVTTECPFSNDTMSNNSFTKERLLDIRNELIQQADTSAADWMKDTQRQTRVQRWIRDIIKAEIDAWNKLVSDHVALSAKASKNATMPTLDANGTVAAVALSPAKNTPMERIRKSIAARLLAKTSSSDAELAATYDYAMLWNGATVVASSPSLADQLPMINRLAARLQLRFYGYGPEAALTPPVTTVSGGGGGAATVFSLSSKRLVRGQCWSFHPPHHQAAPMRDDTSRRGGLFGFLTIRLADAVYVESVVVEHLLPSASSSGDRGWTSAIRRFSIVGFEQSEDDEKVWKLGSFEYKANKASSESRQEFFVEAIVGGVDVPMLRVIRLEVDSNWGADYVCLYRFRVHAQEGQGGFDDDYDNEEEDDEE